VEAEKEEERKRLVRHVMPVPALCLCGMRRSWAARGPGIVCEECARGGGVRPVAVSPRCRGTGLAEEEVGGQSMELCLVPDRSARGRRGAAGCGRCIWCLMGLALPCPPRPPWHAPAQIAAREAEVAEDKRRREEALRREKERIEKELEEREMEEAKVGGRRAGAGALGGAVGEPRVGIGRWSGKPQASLASYPFLPK